MNNSNLEVENYEHNLKIHYDTKRKELEVLLSTSMPAQLSNIKTLLWFNVVSVAFTLRFHPLMTEWQRGYILLAAAAIISALASMLVGRQKDYGAPEDMALASTYADDEWTKSQFLIDMLHTTQRAIELNRAMVSRRADLMRLSTYYTFVGTCLLILLLYYT